MKKRDKKTIIYSDPVNDEFSGVGPRPKITVGKNYPYIRRGPIYRFFRFIVYKIIMLPVAHLYCFFKFRVKFVGREKIVPYKKSGMFIYGNHTQIPGDAFIPNVLLSPHDAYFVVNPDNVALRGTRMFMTMVGAIPTPTEIGGFGPFGKAIEQRISEGAAVVIFPEAHIWPYYVGIRPFASTSFRYPAKSGSPVFSLTVTYRRGRTGRPRVVAYVDGPFFAEGSVREAQEALREAVYSAMCSRAETPDNYEFVVYKPACGTDAGEGTEGTSSSEWI